MNILINCTYMYIKFEFFENIIQNVLSKKKKKKHELNNF